MTAMSSIRHNIVNALLVVASCLLTVAVAEIAVRMYLGRLLSTDTLRAADVTVAAGPRAIYDANLGWLPKPGSRIGESSVTIGQFGLREHGTPDNYRETQYILAVGDSFTFGDGVNDHESWPAHLERRSGWPVLNGGVFGYGVDQTVLRAQSLLEHLQPSVLIVSMIADDLSRNELAFRYGWKPYFEIAAGKLQLRNVPVPQREAPVRLRWLRDALDYSYLANGVFRRLAPGWWHHQGVEQRVHQQGLEVAMLLMRKIATMVRSRGIDVIVVAQADRTLDAETLHPVLATAAENGLHTLDLASPLANMMRNDPTLDDVMFLGPYAGHMTSAGNDWVARQIAEKLRTLHPE